MIYTSAQNVDIQTSRICTINSSDIFMDFNLIDLATIIVKKADFNKFRINGIQSKEIDKLYKLKNLEIIFECTINLHLVKKLIKIIKSDNLRLLTPTELSLNQKQILLTISPQIQFGYNAYSLDNNQWIPLEIYLHIQSENNIIICPNQTSQTLGQSIESILVLVYYIRSFNSKINIQLVPSNYSKPKDIFELACRYLLFASKHIERE